MLPPSTKDIMDISNSKYAVVVAVAKRARVLSEQKKNDELKKSNEDEKKAYFTNLNKKLSAVQEYGGQVVDAYSQLSNAYYAGLQKELEAQSNANSKRLAENENALSVTRGRLEKATGKQKKELQIQLANEENIKRQTLKNAEEIERNTCVPSIIKVDAIEAFTCKAKGKVSQQTIDDVKYNVCTCKE